MTVIDLGSLASIIQQIEEVFDKNGCNHADKVYVMQQMLNKHNQEIQQQRTQDMMGKIDPKEMIKRLMGGKE